MGASLLTADFEIFLNFDKVQKVITLEHPRSADPFGPSIGTRPRWANLFPLRTLKYFEILTKSKRWLRWKIRNWRVVLDLPVEKYREWRVFRSDTFSKDFQSPKGDYAGTSAIGRSVWTEHRDKTPMGESLPTTDLEIFWNFDKVQKVITLEDPQSASRYRPASRETFMGASLPTADFEILWNFDKVQKVITLKDA